MEQQGPELGHQTAFSSSSAAGPGHDAPAGTWQPGAGSSKDDLAEVLAESSEHSEHSGGSSGSSAPSAHGGKQSLARKAAGLPSPISGCDDFSGDVQRRVSRMQAISASHPLTTWKREWCVASHNFLTFFASRTDVVVTKCVLFSEIASATVDKDGRTVRIHLSAAGSQGQGEIVIRVHPVSASKEGASSADARGWAEEVNRRARILADSGEKILPCITAEEARRIISELEKELEEAETCQAREAQVRLNATRQKALAGALATVLATKVHSVKRVAFEELLVHLRLKAVHRMQSRSAVMRIVRALQNPEERLVHSAVIRWASVCTTEQVVLGEQLRRSLRKRLHLGAAMLVALFRDHGRDSARWAMVKLRWHAEGMRQRKADAGFEQSMRTLGRGRPESRVEPAGPEVVAAQRLRVGGHLLRGALRHLQVSRREWALRTWAIATARAAQAEAQDLIHCTEELNEQLLDRCHQMPLESLAGVLVLSLRAAQMRQVLFAFVALAAFGRRSGLNGECSRSPRNKLTPLPGFGANGTFAPPQRVVEKEVDIKPDPGLTFFSPIPRAMDLAADSPNGVH